MAVPGDVETVGLAAAEVAVGPAPVVLVGGSVVVELVFCCTC